MWLMIIGRDQVKKLDQDINKSSKFIKKQIFKFHFPKTKKIKVDNEKLILLGVVMGIRQRSIGQYRLMDWNTLLDFREWRWAARSIIVF